MAMRWKWEKQAYSDRSFGEDMNEVFDVQGKAHGKHNDAQRGTIRIRTPLHEPGKRWRSPEGDQPAQHHVHRVQAGRKCNPILPFRRHRALQTINTQSLIHNPPNKFVLPSRKSRFVPRHRKEQQARARHSALAPQIESGPRILYA